MTIRVNDVTITRIDGARLNTVTSRTRRTIWLETLPPPWPRSTLIDWATALPALDIRPSIAVASSLGRTVRVDENPLMPWRAGWSGSPCVGRHSITVTPPGPTASRCSTVSRRTSTSRTRGSRASEAVTASRAPGGSRRTVMPPYRRNSHKAASRSISTTASATIART